MTNTLNYLLESGLSLGLFTLFFVLVLRPEKSFVFNRFYLLGSVVLSMAIPLIHIPVGSIPEGFTAGTVFLDSIELNKQPTGNLLHIPTLLIWSYGLISIFLLGRLIVKLLKVLLRKGTRINTFDFSYVELKNSSEAYTLFNTIYLGEQLDSDERRLILSHERVHVREYHSIDLIFLELITVVLWINPFLYIIKSLARANHEYLADARAMMNDNRDLYIQTLAAHSLKKHGFALTHSFYASTTLKRINMINKQNHKIMRIKQLVPFGLAIVLIIVFGCEENGQSLGDIGNIQAVGNSEYTMQDGVYDKVEEAPSPIGGMAEFFSWVTQNLKYPEQAKKKGVEGQVLVQFILDPSGNMTQVKAVKGIGGGCDEAAVELIKSAAPWNPGKMGGKAVSVRMVLPINFKISG